MGFKLVELNAVNVKVEGSLANEDGKFERFDYTLQCARMSADDLKEKLADTQVPTKDFMVEVVIGWNGVTDAANIAVPFTNEACNALLNIPGMAGLAFNAYLEQQAAKAKN
jgi:acetaldehyde dehydrogenase (acetylating)